MTFTFFGLGSNYRPVLHKEIFFLLVNGEGGFTHSEVYNMPISMRSFYVKCLIHRLKEQRKQIEEARNKKSKKSKMPTIPKMPKMSRK